MDPLLDDQFERQFFSYVFDATVGANNVQQPGQLQILSDADFEWWWVLASRDFIGTTASATSGPATFNGINIDNWAGTALATAAFPLAVPYIMPATRVYTILLTDSSGGTNTVEIVFSGFKLWPRPKVG